MEQIIQITSREFRSNQKKFFDLADKGIQVILRRGKKQSYTLVPVSDDDLYLSQQFQEKIKKSIQEARDGEVRRIDDENEFKELLGL